MDTNPSGTPVPEAPERSNQAGEDVKKEALGFVAKVEAKLDEWMVTKAPFQIPMSGKEVLAGIAPYFIIGTSLISIPAFYTGIILALAAIFSVDLLSGLYLVDVFVTTIAAGIVVAGLICNMIAIPGLFKRTHKSWHFLFYSGLFFTLASIIFLQPIWIIGCIINLYILFQVKELYRN